MFRQREDEHGVFIHCERGDIGSSPKTINSFGPGLYVICPRHPGAPAIVGYSVSPGVHALLKCIEVGIRISAVMFAFPVGFRDGLILVRAAREVAEAIAESRDVIYAKPAVHVAADAVDGSASDFSSRASEFAASSAYGWLSPFPKDSVAGMVYDAMAAEGGRAFLKDIYTRVADLARSRELRPPSGPSIRCQLQRHSSESKQYSGKADVFRPDGVGIWRLRGAGQG